MKPEAEEETQAQTPVMKRFDDLSARELYEILRLRSEIFIVEQDCVYQDVDYIDYRALHFILARSDGKVDAYLRLYEKEEEPGVLWIGRVVTSSHRKGLGSRVLDAALSYIRIARNRKTPVVVHIESQCQARGFYEKFGFRAISEPFIMDQLPHIKMELRLV
ncbi:MAG: GNAT family N-acetyltransferase [Thermoguttaceae bacterium]